MVVETQTTVADTTGTVPPVADTTTKVESAGTTTETAPSSETGAGSAGSDGSNTTPTEESFTKLDPKTLSSEGLRAYKKLQADYTRARQADKEIQKKLEEQIRSYQPLMSDKDVQAKAYFLQFGKYPEGYTPVFGQPQPQQPAEEQINPDEITDPLVKQMYLDNQKLKQENAERAKKEQAELVDKTNKGVKSFYDALPEAHKKLWQENLDEITEFATISASKGKDLTVALKRAFNAAVGDKLFEMGKQEALASMKNKIEKPKPETGNNLDQDHLVAGQAKTAEEAVRGAIRSLKQ